MIKIFILFSGLFAAPIFAETVEPQQAQEEMANLLQKFPQLSACTAEQQEEALAFYQETQKIQALLKEASQSVEDLNGEAAQSKVAEATELLKNLTQ